MVGGQGRRITSELHFTSLLDSLERESLTDPGYLTTPSDPPVYPQTPGLLLQVHGPAQCFHMNAWDPNTGPRVHCELSSPLDRFQRPVC